MAQRQRTNGIKKWVNTPPTVDVSHARQQQADIRTCTVCQEQKFLDPLAFCCDECKHAIESEKQEFKATRFDGVVRTIVAGLLLAGCFVCGVLTAAYFLY